MPYRQPGRKPWYIRVPTRTGAVQRSTGSVHKPTALAMENMLAVLGARREWEVLDSVIAGSITLGTLYDAYRNNDLAGLRLVLDNQALKPHVEPWLAFLDSKKKSSKTVTGYHRAVKAWLAAHPGVIDINVPSVRHWLDTMKVTPTTRNNYLIGLSSFIQYLREVRVVSGNPLEGLTRPKPNPPRMQFLTLPQVQTLLEATPDPYRQLYRLMYATGVELGAAIGLLVEAVQPERYLIRAPGTKAHNRDRVVKVAVWARTEVESLWLNRSPAERLFEGARYRLASLTHSRVAESLGFKVTLHDARHHWAVRSLRTGWPIEGVARQLGHADARMVVKVYGRFVPDDEDLERWAQRSEVMETTLSSGISLTVGSSQVVDSKEVTE